MKNFRRDKGITLIALVVTIVVLLILAGITISTLFGENGIINSARKAADETVNAENTTSQGLENLEGQMTDAMDNSSLISLIKSNSFVTAEQGNQIVTDKTGKIIIVPVAFRVTNNATEIDKGVVIEDKLQNQYVWVPVSDTQFDEIFGTNDNGVNYFGKSYDFSVTGKNVNSYPIEPTILTEYDGSNATIDASYFKAVMGDMTADQFKNELQAKFNDMAKSVKQYKGFYVGRYETSSLNTPNPKTVKGVYPNYGINWYNIYKNMQGIETYTDSEVQSDVKTNMIWGCQWDRTLDWIANTDSNIGYAELKDSKTWGNHKNSETFTYTNIDGIEKIKAKGTITLIPTGSTERNKVNNIYDLAGNLAEWTMEGSRIFRGGNYGNSSALQDIACDRCSTLPTYSGLGYLGSRPTLYVLSNI